MNQRLADTIQDYTTLYPGTRRQFGTIIDAFEYVDDVADMSLLSRVMNRMILSPALASAICSLGVGYEQNIETLPPDRVSDFNDTLKSVGRIAYTKRDSIPRLRTIVNTVRAQDESIENLVRIASLDETACTAQNNRFRRYKCDVPKEPETAQCGLNTNFTCEKGITSGTNNCEISIGNRCKLSQIGKQNKARTAGKKRVDVITNAARTAYLAARS